jgi:cytochrome b
MATAHDNVMVEAGGVTPPATVKVWDLFVRVFHWSLVALFLIAYVTGDEIEQVHIMAGYTIAGLLLLRVVWGFIGARHARFTDFVRSPREAIVYMRDAMLFRARRYIGHNPAGGLMVIALVAMLIGTCVTGYMMTTDAYWGSDAMEDIHGALANATVALIVLHVFGVLFASFEHRENLIKAMVTGRKRAG